jgi:hypothetical protein
MPAEQAGRLIKVKIFSLARIAIHLDLLVNAVNSSKAPGAADG